MVTSPQRAYWDAWRCGTAALQQRYRNPADLYRFPLSPLPLRQAIPPFLGGKSQFFLILSSKLLRVRYIVFYLLNYLSLRLNNFNSSSNRLLLKISYIFNPIKYLVYRYRDKYERTRLPVLVAVLRVPRVIPYKVRPQRKSLRYRYYLRIIRRDLKIQEILKIQILVRLKGLGESSQNLIGIRLYYQRIPVVPQITRVTVIVITQTDNSDASLPQKIIIIKKSERYGD